MLAAIAQLQGGNVNYLQASNRFVAWASSLQRSHSFPGFP
jgi:hypothetical protein